jgi:preprotein translocase subunit SecE
MATKAALVNGEERPSPGKLSPVKRQAANDEGNLLDKIVGTWKEFAGFLSDVRAEMRKVVTPSRKEVKATTTVVLVAVILFGLFFFVVDWFFGLGLTNLLNRLSGLQQ